MHADLVSLLEALEAEQHSLQDTLSDLAVDDWFRPTPARGWDVRDTVAHLADTDELAIDTCLDGERSLNEYVKLFASAEDVTLSGVLRGRRLPGVEVLAWWQRTSFAEREVLAALDPATRVPWGLGMRPPSFITARLMETWAHGLDARAALGVAAPDTDRLRHIAWLAYRALPYAFSVAGRQPPPGDLRVELVPPAGDDPGEYGPADAPNRITGPAGEFCRLFVQRLPREEATALTAQGAGAVAALEVARAFL